MGELANYLAARERNRILFASGLTDVLEAFEVAFRASQRLGEVLTTQHDQAGKTHVSLAPFFLIFQRQAFAAFEALSANQAFQAWVSVRPGIESVLIMGKWVQDKHNAEIWERRFEDPVAYRRCYSGKALANGALPRSSDIQGALRHINDHFIHPNPKYYYRHLWFNDLENGSTEMRLEFFDDEDDVALGVLGVLHLVAVTQSSLSSMFGALFPAAPVVDVGLDSLEARAGSWVEHLRRRGPFFDWAITEIGLWPTPASPDGGR